MIKKQTKRVNVFPSRQAITGTNPPIRGKIRGVRLTTTDIRKCLMARAYVEEVLKDGSTVVLGLHNYNKDNEPTAEAAQETTTATAEPVEEAKVEETVTEESTTVEETKEEVKEDKPVVEEKKVSALERLKAQKEAAAEAVEDAENEELAEEEDTSDGVSDELEVMDMSELGL